MTGTSSARVKHYDTLIIGAGTAGSVLAARLSEDAQRSVLLIEAGPHYGAIENYPRALRHGTLTSGCLQHDPHNWGFVAELLPGRKQLAPRGKVFGGSSALNGTLFVRGLPADYDAWAAAGNDLWSFEQVLPYFKKLETDRDFQDPWHGDDGPLPISRVAREKWSRPARAFFEACRAAGYADIADMNQPGVQGVGVVPTNNLDGLRLNTAVRYLEPVLGRANLAILDRAVARRIIFDGKRAVAVDVERAGAVVRHSAGEIIVCAGAVASAHLLQLSGVGPGDALRRLGIEPICDSPMVGQNASDHCSARVFFSASAAQDIDLTLPACPMNLHLTAPGSDIADDLEILLFAVPMGRRLMHGVSWPNRMRILAATARQMGWAGLLEQVRRAAEPALSCSLMAGKSRGQVTLVSGDARVAPLIKHNFLSHPDDIGRLRHAVRTGVALLASDAFAQLGARRTVPGDAVLENDAQLDPWIRATLATGAHLSGTCRMGPATDPSAVVDQHCRVHGVEGLRVIDAAIMPTIPRRGPFPTVVMIAERAADLMR